QGGVRCRRRSGLQCHRRRHAGSVSPRLLRLVVRPARGCMKIDRVYISNYKGDVRFLRPCVASIRTWYPEIPITIIQDLNGGAYRLDEACAAWNLELYETEVQRFGSGWSRLEPLFHT